MNTKRGASVGLRAHTLQHIATVAFETTTGLPTLMAIHPRQKFIRASLVLAAHVVSA